MSEKLSGTSHTKVLVYGWYNKANIGDDLFADAFRHLFPEFDFTFTDDIDETLAKSCDAIFFGGGSFLYDAPRITSEALQIIKNKPILYIGVGVEADINSVHLDLMRKAKFIAIRSADQLSRVQKINSTTMVIPDLVFALQEQVVQSEKQPRSVLILPNIMTVPQLSDPNWKHTSWAHFKSQFCQFLDGLVENGVTVNFLPFCSNNELDDNWPAAELVAHMMRRDKGYLLAPIPSTMADVSRVMSSYETIITQRYHGIVLAEMVRVPYVSIHHHDKLKNFQSNNGRFLSYYHASKQELLSAYQHARVIKNSSILPIETNIFEDLRKCVISLIK